MTRKEMAAALRKEAGTCSEKCAAANARLAELQAEVAVVVATAQETGQRYSDLMSAAQALEAMSK